MHVFAYLLKTDVDNGFLLRRLKEATVGKRIKEAAHDKTEIPLLTGARAAHLENPAGSDSDSSDDRDGEEAGSDDNDSDNDGEDAPMPTFRQYWARFPGGASRTVAGTHLVRSAKSMSLSRLQAQNDNPV